MTDILKISNKGKASPRDWFKKRLNAEEYGREQAIRDFVGTDRAPAVLAALRPQPKTIAEIMPDVLKSHMVKKDDPMNTVRDNWLSLVGPDISAVAHPHILYNGVLTIAVTNSSWKFVLERQQKRSLLAKLQTIKSANITDLKFILCG